MSNFKRCGWNGCMNDADEVIHARSLAHEFHGALCHRHAEEVIKGIGPTMIRRSLLRPMSVAELMVDLAISDVK